MDTVRARMLVTELGMVGNRGKQDELLMMLYQHQALAELDLPAQAQGAFINAGHAFDAMVSVGKLLASAKISARIVDPYMDEKALTDFAVLCNEQVAVELLADATHVKPGLEPAARRFTAQYAAARPVQVRLAIPRILHDRLIVIDAQTVWSLTQSLNAFATRSPASIVRIDGDAAALKIAAYDDFWRQATVLM